MSLRMFFKEGQMFEGVKIVFSGHSLVRIKERTKLKPEQIAKMFEKGAFCEAHRKNGVKYFVLWSNQDNLPYLAVVKDSVLVSIYYTYELHRRGDDCIILPVHIALARKAQRLYSAQESIICQSRRYRLYAFWEELTPAGKNKAQWKKVASFTEAEYDAFGGNLLEFISGKPEIMATLNNMEVPKWSKVSLILKKKKSGEIVGSVEISS